MTRVFLLCAIALLAVCALPSFTKDFVKDVQCPGKKQTCGDDEKCCPVGDGQGDYLCCALTNVPSSSCCGDGCCSDNEGCCLDANAGAVCCVLQDTFCVATSSTRPSRCCPRWTVGCSSGSVGCCDPAQPYQWTIAASQPLPRGQSKTVQRIAAEAPITSITSITSSNPGSLSGPSTGGRVAYALVIGGFEDALQALTIDVPSGNILTKQPVKGFDDAGYGASTREFLWDSSRKLFYYLDANFTVNAGDRPPKGRPTFLITVDPVKATWTQTAIKGATDYPTGYCMLESTNDILMACEHYDSNSTMVGFEFFQLDPTTAAATSVSKVARGADESDPNFYAGYHRSCSGDGKLVYRLGYEHVTTQSGPGIGLTDLKAETTQWRSEQSTAHDFFMTFSQYTNGTFLSLAPRLSDVNRSLDLVQWSLDESVYKVVSQLDNAHPPRLYGGGYLGYLASAIAPAKDLWVALVVQQGTDKYQITDRYALASLDFSAGAANVTLSPLVPRDVAGTWSVSGLGV